MLNMFDRKKSSNESDFILISNLPLYFHEKNYKNVWSTKFVKQKWWYSYQLLTTIFSQEKMQNNFSVKIQRFFTLISREKLKKII